MLQAIGVPRESLYGTPEQKARPLLEFCGRSGRHLMQTLGTEWGRDAVGDTIWLDAWERSIRGDRVVFVDDLRFPNEAKRIVSLGGIVIMVKTDLLQEVTDSHPSAQFHAIRHHGLIINPRVPSGWLDDIEERLASEVISIMEATGNLPLEIVT